MIATVFLITKEGICPFCFLTNICRTIHSVFILVIYHLIVFSFPATMMVYGMAKEKECKMKDNLLMIVSLFAISGDL